LFSLYTSLCASRFKRNHLSNAKSSIYVR
jgi:hypothetical protein